MKPSPCTKRIDASLAALMALEPAEREAIFDHFRAKETQAASVRGASAKALAAGLVVSALAVSCGADSIAGREDPQAATGLSPDFSVEVSDSVSDDHLPESAEPPEPDPLHYPLPPRQDRTEERLEIDFDYPLAMTCAKLMADTPYDRAICEGREALEMVIINPYQDYRYLHLSASRDPLERIRYDHIREASIADIIRLVRCYYEPLGIRVERRTEIRPVDPANPVNTLHVKGNAWIREFDPETRRARVTAGMSPVNRGNSNHADTLYATTALRIGNRTPQYLGNLTIGMIGGHELGHAFGLDHDDDPDSLMFPVQNPERAASIYLPPFQAQTMARNLWFTAHPANSYDQLVRLATLNGCGGVAQEILANESMNDR